MQTLVSYKDIHRGETIIACGCGSSLAELKHPERFITIGVNDVGRMFDPTYLVVLNAKRQFKGDRFRYVEESRARAVFTQLDLGIKHPNVVRFNLGKRGGTDLSDSSSLPYTNNSPYVALCLAAFMGARRIGMIGVDFSDHHFFAKTGRHSLAGQLSQINAEYAQLAQSLARGGIEIVNLSEGSRLSAFPRPSEAERAAFLGHSSVVPMRKRSLNIISYATTPMAGVPAILARCINAKTEHSARCVWAGNGYGNGVIFAGDVEWTKAASEADSLLRQADLIIVHNGKVERRHEPLFSGKAVITMAHNYMWNVDQRFVKQGRPGVVVGQYQATLPEFKDWAVVPNPVPLWEPLYQPGGKGTSITICYTPSGKHERYPQGHRLYWHAKGYDTTMRILDSLAKRLPIKLEVIRGRQVSHDEALRMKQRAHIVIDECVTGSYHRNSLEGLAAGCVVVNGFGILPSVTEAFQHCSGNKGHNPFIFATLDTLEKILEELIASGSAALLQKGAANRQWMEENWNFRTQWERFWMPVIGRALEKAEKSAATSQKERRHARAAVSTSKTSTLTGSVQKTATARNNKSEKDSASGSSIPVYWTCRGSKNGNFGDMLSPLIVAALAGRPAHYSHVGPRLFAVGSLLKFARADDFIWGSGFISAEDVCERGVRVYAVRGPLTRKKLLETGIECPEIYGDPALMLPWLYPFPQVVRSGIGVIPHYVDADFVRAAVQDPAVRIIDIRAGVEEVLRLANTCEVLLSSSLHGCIVGDAYGIPTAWVHISDRVVGKGFKFLDHYAATRRDPVCVDWRSGIRIADAVEAAVRAPKPNLDMEPLFRSFPYRRGGVQSLDDLRMRRADRASETGIRHASGEHQYTPAIVLTSSMKTQTVTAPTHNGQPDDSGRTDSHVMQRLEHRLAIFSAGTENYVPQMVTSLRSFKLQNENRPFDYYVFGHSFSAQTRRLLERHEINYMDLDLSALFARRQRDLYPSECFWILKGPEIFARMGFAYSLSVDGDTWCNRRLDLDWLPRMSHIAGVNRGSNVAQFLTALGQYRRLKAEMHIPAINYDRIATNTGVLFYNNKELADLGFFERITEVYRRSEAAGVIRGGDDSTLALLLAVHTDIKLFVLDHLWNAYRGMYKQFSRDDPAYHFHLADWIEKAYIVHHINIKPWKFTARFPNRVTEHFVTLWKDLWCDTLDNTMKIPAAPECSGQDSLERSDIVCQERNIRSKRNFRVNCYWYRGTKPNMGDETAPYLLKKIIGWSPEIRLWDAPCDPSEASAPVLLSIGSVLRLCSGNAVVWGSGIRNIDQPVKKAWRFCAVRGPLTRRRLLQLGYDCPETYGDPALLLPRYFHPVVKRRYDLGVIPHAHDYSLLSKRYGRHRNVLVVDVATSSIESVVRQILSCECTASSALHGLVLSVAYGIPTRWLRCSDKIMGDDTKFYDFFASLNPAVTDALDTSSVTLPERDEALTPYRPIRMHGVTIPPEELAMMTFRHQLAVDLDRLLKACPIDGSGWKPGVL